MDSFKKSLKRKLSGGDRYTENLDSNLMLSPEEEKKLFDDLALNPEIDKLEQIVKQGKNLDSNLMLSREEEKKLFDDLALNHEIDDLEQIAKQGKNFDNLNELEDTVKLLRSMKQDLAYNMLKGVKAEFNKGNKKSKTNQKI